MQFKILVDCGFDQDNQNQVRESDLNLQMGLKLKDLVYADTDICLVVLDRVTDDQTNLVESRLPLTQESKFDIIFSLHSRVALTPAERGVFVYYNDMDKNSALLADIVSSSLQVINLQPFDMPVKREKASNEILNSFFAKLTSPAIVINTGFLSNQVETDMVKTFEFQQTIVKGIYDGIKNFLTLQTPIKTDLEALPKEDPKHI